MLENEQNFDAVFYKIVLGMLLKKTCAVINNTKTKQQKLDKSAHTSKCLHNFQERIVEKLEIFLDLLDLHDLKENFEIE